MLKIVSLVTGAAVLAFAGVAAAVALAGSSTSASIYTYKSTLSRGVEVPKPKAPATAKGVFTATVTEKGSTRTLRWKLTFSGLSGKASAAHIHRGKAGVAGGVLIALCGPCKNGQIGTQRISSSVGDTLERGRIYVNVHTNKNPGGEIRGQVRLTGHTGESSSSSTNTGPATTTTSTDDGGGGYGYG